ncbi:MAG: hypothetical protein GC185_11085 [Alphaproteobacteria bacterium]|nr:hypothetical protein [Alphaproteobacteria bacterium]
MKLVTPLQQAVDKTAKGTRPPSQAIAADDEEAANEQARMYARALIGKGALKGVPQEIGVGGPMSDQMLQAFFQQAKDTLVIVTGIGGLAREATFTSLALQAMEKKNCTVVICGDRDGVAGFLAGKPEFEKHIPVAVDMDSPGVTAELAQAAQEEKDAALRAVMDVRLKNDVKPMAPIRIVKKPRP